MTITQKLVKLIYNKKISKPDLNIAKIYCLDAMANSIAGSSTLPGKILNEWYSRHTENPSRKAFLLASRAHILETDDLHRASVTHPGCIVVPVALSLGTSLNSTGKDILISIIYGFEAMCRIGMALGPEHYRIWHNTATCGPYGAAMTASYLLKLNNKQTVDALGNAGTQSSGLWEFLKSGAMSKHLHAGRAAESGVLAAELASLGFTGPPTILEGKKGFFAATSPKARPNNVLKNADERWQIYNTSLKPWPSCRHTHPAIDATLSAVSKLKGNNTIKQIHINTYQAAIDVCDNPNPKSEYEAKFSLQHNVAAAAYDRKINFDSYIESARKKHKKNIDLVRISSNNVFNLNYPKAWGAKVIIKLNNGKIISSTKKNALGDPESPLNEKQKAEKIKELFSLTGKNNDLIDIIKSLDSEKNSKIFIKNLS